MELNDRIIKCIQKMPKIELHLHLEGAFTLDFLFKLIQKSGGYPTINNIEDLKKKFVFIDFPHFIKTWHWKNSFYKQPQDFEESIYYTLEHLHMQNVIYVEAFYSPWEYDFSAHDMTKSALKAVNRAEREFGIRCKLIADLSRDLGWENAIKRCEDIIPFKEKGVIGIGLGGSEQKFPADPFKHVYDFARKNGLHVVAHAGEAAGAESIWSVINNLKVERIGHGVRAIEDPELVEFLYKKQIPLEVCVNSNIKTAMYSTINEHPIVKLFKKGLLVTINSDDPTMFGMTLTEEFLQLYEKLDFSLDEIKILLLNTIKASFLSDDVKMDYVNQINTYFLENK